MISEKFIPACLCSGVDFFWGPNWRWKSEESRKLTGSVKSSLVATTHQLLRNSQEGESLSETIKFVLSVGNGIQFAGGVNKSFD